jgi:hypothetical protein
MEAGQVFRRVKPKIAVFSHATQSAATLALADGHAHQAAIRRNRAKMLAVLVENLNAVGC